MTAGTAFAPASPAVTTVPTEPLLQVDGLVKHYRLPRQRLLQAAPVVAALRGVSFSLQAGRSLGIVGESGSGKSTLARQVMALEAPTAGSVRLLGRDLNALSRADLALARRDFQMVFQDPYGSLDPRQRIGRVVAEPLTKLPAADAGQRVAESLEAVGLRASDALKYAHEFSGGQRQRIAIARALITRPKLIVADEPVSALDVSVQAQVLNLLADLQQQFGVTYLFISHDLAVVDHVCDEVAVMYAGRIVEQGAPEVLFSAAAHPYTRALLAAMPAALMSQGLVSEGLVSRGLVSQGLASQGLVSEGPVSKGLVPEDPVPKGPVSKGLVPEDPVSKGPVSKGLVPEGPVSEGLVPEGPVSEGLAASAATAGMKSARVSAADTESLFPPRAEPPACSFAPRCPYAQTRCLTEPPPLRAVANGHRAACHFAESVMTERPFSGESRR